MVRDISIPVMDNDEHPRDPQPSPCAFDEILPKPEPSIDLNKSFNLFQTSNGFSFIGIESIADSSEHSENAQMAEVGEGATGIVDGRSD
ncbi:hypothetical protein L1887_11375 [Cichorium endivia]|nr:hypothetical protein L1887_11375 [Cichorium endivia]